MKKIVLTYTLCLLLSVTLTAQKKKKDKDVGLPKMADKEHVVLISTSLGDMKVKLYDATPKHRDNFLKLAQENFYDSLLFHRVIPNFMIQGGDPLSKNAAPGVPLGSGDNGFHGFSSFHRVGNTHRVSIAEEPEANAFRLMFSIHQPERVSVRFSLPPRVLKGPVGILQGRD